MLDEKCAHVRRIIMLGASVFSRNFFFFSSFRNIPSYFENARWEYDIVYGRSMLVPASFPPFVLFVGCLRDLLFRSVWVVAAAIIMNYLYPSPTRRFAVRKKTYPKKKKKQQKKYIYTTRGIPPSFSLSLYFIAIYTYIHIYKSLFVCLYACLDEKTTAPLQQIPTM